MQICCCIFI